MLSRGKFRGRKHSSAYVYAHTCGKKKSKPDSNARNGRDLFITDRASRYAPNQKNYSSPPISRFVGGLAAQCLPSNRGGFLECSSRRFSHPGGDLLADKWHNANRKVFYSYKPPTRNRRPGQRDQYATAYTFIHNARLPRAGRPGGRAQPANVPSAASYGFPSLFTRLL